jgi:hypothetical protein
MKPHAHPGGRWWLMPVILDSKSTRPYLKNKLRRAEGVAQETRPRMQSSARAHTHTHTHAHAHTHTHAQGRYKAGH